MGKSPSVYVQRKTKIFEVPTNTCHVRGGGLENSAWPRRNVFFPSSTCSHHQGRGSCKIDHCLELYNSTHGGSNGTYYNETNEWTSWRMNHSRYEVHSNETRTTKWRRRKRFHFTCRDDDQGMFVHFCTANLIRFQGNQVCNANTRDALFNFFFSFPFSILSSFYSRAFLFLSLMPER